MEDILPTNRCSVEGTRTVRYKCACGAAVGPVHTALCFSPALVLWQHSSADEAVDHLRTLCLPATKYINVACNKECRKVLTSYELKGIYICIEKY